MVIAASSSSTWLTHRRQKLKWKMSSVGEALICMVIGTVQRNGKTGFSCIGSKKSDPFSQINLERWMNVILDSFVCLKWGMKYDENWNFRWNNSTLRLRLLFLQYSSKQWRRQGGARGAIAPLEYGLPPQNFPDREHFGRWSPPVTKAPRSMKYIAPPDN